MESNHAMGTMVSAGRSFGRVRAVRKDGPRRESDSDLLWFDLTPRQRAGHWLARLVSLAVIAFIVTYH